MGAAVLWRTRQQAVVSALPLFVLAVSVTPWLQYGAGMLLFHGNAWMAFSYLLAFALAIVIGQGWERFSPAQAADGLFFAIGIACVGSVGLQLHQWLQINWLDIWSMGNGFGRPYANFGQPNQLGTLLLWGILAAAWGWQRGHIRPVVAIAAMVFVLFGVALTASRTAWIGLLLLVAACWYWRRLWHSRAVPWVACALLGVFVLFAWAIPRISIRLMLATESGVVDEMARVATESRPQIWALFLDAARHKPWFGYGWNQASEAHLAVALNHPPLKILFTHAHNLFLELLIYCGMPFGLLISGVLCAWLWRRFRAVEDAGSAMMFLLIAVAANHAMLEFPLQYAYFLLPVGLMAGALDTRLRAQTFAVRWRAPVLLLWLACALLLGTLVRDYLRVEASYQALRFELANFRTTAAREPPDVVLLDQLRDLIVLARFEPSAGMPAERLDWMRRVALQYPSAGVVHKLVVALAWNGHPDEAVLWFRRMCTLVPETQCGAIRNALNKQAQTDPRIAAIPWP
ncbi:MAG: Wzy polymerase domain-containing protein [Burkholderiaceae bacterium]